MLNQKTKRPKWGAILLNSLALLLVVAQSLPAVRVAHGMGADSRSVQPVAGNRHVVNEAESGIDYDGYADPIFASIVHEFPDDDAHVAPTFVSEDGTVVNSVAFDGEEPCVPVLVLKGYFHWPGGIV